jgi:PST family polysaccharide transporter
MWTFLERSGRELISLLVLVVLARVLAPADFGLFAMAGAAIRFLTLFQASGFSSAIVQREQIDESHLNTAFWIVILISLTLALTLWFGAGYFASFFGEPRVAELIRWLALMPVLGALGQVQMQLLRRRMRFKALATRTFVATPISGAAAIVAALAGLGVWSLVIRQLAQRVVMVVVCWKVGGWRPGFTFSKSRAVELISFGGSMMAANAVNFVRGQGPVVIIGRVLGATELGYYNMALRIFELTKDALVDALGQVLYPMFSRLQGDKTKLREAYASVARFSGVVALPAFTGILIVAPSLLPAAFGAKWQVTVPVLQILSLQAIVESMSHYNPTLLVATGHPHLRLLILAMAAAVGLPMALIAVHWGIEAVAVAYLLEATLLALLSWWMISRLVGVRFATVWPSVRGPFAASLMMALAVLGAATLLRPVERLGAGPLGPWPGIVALVLIGVLVYATALIRVDRRIIADFRSVLSAARQGAP